MSPRDCSTSIDCFVTIMILETSSTSRLRPPYRLPERVSAGKCHSKSIEWPFRQSEQTSMAISQVSSLEPPQSKYDRMIARAKKVKPATTLVVPPCDESSLRAAIEAADAGIIVPILVGPAARVNAVA